MITKTQYCKNIIETFKLANGLQNIINNDDLVPYIHTSTKLGIALEYLGVISENNHKEEYEFIQSRSGTEIVYYDFIDQDPCTLTTREMISLLPDDYELKQQDMTDNEKAKIHYKNEVIEGSVARDCRDQIVFRSDEKISKENELAKSYPFENVDFITMDKKDAENILDMLNNAITRLESGTRNDNDVEVFGEKAISYERLIDCLNKTIY